MPVAVVFFLSCFLAFIGGHMVNYTAIIYAQDVFGSNSWAGIGFGLCFGMPLVFGWFAGVYCDRIPPSKLVIAAQLTFVLVAGCFAWLDQFGDGRAAQLMLFIVATGLAGLGWSFLAPSRLAVLAQIVAPKKLHQATVFFNLLVMVGFGLAPMLIAGLRETTGWLGVFAVIAGLFLMASLLFLGIRTLPTTDRSVSVLAQMRQGFCGVRQKPLLAQLLLCSVMVYASLGPLQVLLPQFAKSTLGLTEIERGKFLGILAVSLIFGGILCMVLINRSNPGRSMLWAIVAGSAALFAISLTDGVIMASLALFATGTAGGLSAGLIVAGLQNNAPRAIRGRVLSIYTISSQVIPAASGLLAGICSQYLGVITAIQLCAGTLCVVSVLGLFRLNHARAYGQA